MIPDAPVSATGLSASDAAGRLLADGPNALSAPRQRTPWRLLREVMGEPMFQLLLAAGALYLVLGDLGEALVLLAFVLLTALISLWQGLRTERALAALRDLTSPRALVIRDGRAQRIAGVEVVRGDLLVLSEGDRVAADARLLSANDLCLDESLLTGEAAAVAKQPAGAASSSTAAARPQRPGPEARDRLFAGTLVTRGQGQAEVLATGAATEIGRIGQALGSIEAPDTPLALQIRRLVRLFALLGLGLSALLVLVYGLSRGDWLGAVLAGITLAMSMLPQEFLLILTVFMAMGAWRLARQRVLTRRAATIEALGAATVLCTDKTGTLTENRMAIAELAVPAAADGAGGLPSWSTRSAGLPEPLAPLLAFGLLACEHKPFDTMDQAFGALARERLAAAHLHPDWTLAHDYGLSPGLPAMAHVWRTTDDPAGLAVVAIKGGPEAVAGLCQLSPGLADAVVKATAQMAGRGLRVLAVARAQTHCGPPAGPAWPATPAGFDFDFLGLVGLADPLRASVPLAVQQCRDAGIRVVMITGDHPDTAQAIAAQAGLDNAGAVLTGAELATLDEPSLRRRVATTTLYARVLPEQKLRIVQALQAGGAVVAMTGDGVNDAPSLKAAHIGIAMGGRGTDVAREAASLVLLDDDFNAIVGAVRLGRRIYDNLRKAMAFVLAVHVPIAGLSLLPLLLGWPLVFTPLHIAFLELLIDPACSIAFESEPEEPDVMNRPPRDPAAPLFSTGLIAASLGQGLWVLVLVGAFFWACLLAAVPEAQARAATFAALVLSSLALILVNRSLSGTLGPVLRAPNPTLWRIVGASLGMLALVLWVAPLRRLFRFDALPPLLLAAALAVALGVLLSLLALRWRWPAPRARRSG